MKRRGFTPANAHLQRGIHKFHQTLKHLSSQPRGGVFPEPFPTLYAPIQLTGPSAETRNFPRTSLSKYSVLLNTRPGLPPPSWSFFGERWSDKSPARGRWLTSLEPVGEFRCYAAVHE